MFVPYAKELGDIAVRCTMLHAWNGSTTDERLSTYMISLLTRRSAHTARGDEGQRDDDRRAARAPVRAEASGTSSEGARTSQMRTKLTACEHCLH